MGLSHVKHQYGSLCRARAVIGMGIQEQVPSVRMVFYSTTENAFTFQRANCVVIYVSSSVETEATPSVYFPWRSNGAWSLIHCVFFSTI